MTRRASFTQADLERAIRAAKAEGAPVVRLLPDKTILIELAATTEAAPTSTQPTDGEENWNAQTIRNARPHARKNRELLARGSAGARPPGIPEQVNQTATRRRRGNLASPV